MEKSLKTGAHIYGYTVCLVAIITSLISITSLVNAIIDLQDPLHADKSFFQTPTLASFENYKMDILRSSDNEASNKKEASYIPDDQTLRTMYEAAKNDKIQSVEHQKKRSIIIDSILIFISITLFFIHWKWMKKGVITSE